MPVTMRILGVDYRLCSLNLTREQIESASPSTLKRYIDLSEMELKLARIHDRDDFIYSIKNILRELKAQRKINDNRASLEHGCICG